MLSIPLKSSEVLSSFILNPTGTPTVPPVYSAHWRIIASSRSSELSITDKEWISIFLLNAFVPGLSMPTYFSRSVYRRLASTFSVFSRICLALSFTAFTTWVFLAVTSSLERFSDVYPPHSINSSSDISRISWFWFAISSYCPVWILAIT